MAKPVKIRRCRATVKSMYHAQSQVDQAGDNPSAAALAPRGKEWLCGFSNPITSKSLPIGKDFLFER
jgi:hypothetical protein